MSSCLLLFKKQNDEVGPLWQRIEASLELTYSANTGYKRYQHPVGSCRVIDEVNGRVLCKLKCTMTWLVRFRGAHFEIFHKKSCQKGRDSIKPRTKCQHAVHLYQTAGGPVSNNIQLSQSWALYCRSMSVKASSQRKTRLSVILTLRAAGICEF